VLIVDCSVLSVSHFGGGEDYKILQDSVFVSSEAVSTSETPAEFLLGVKISRSCLWSRTSPSGMSFPDSLLCEKSLHRCMLRGTSSGRAKISKEAPLPSLLRSQRQQV
jgi:hypothetical protein